MLSYSIKLITRMDPIKYLFKKLALIGRMARWWLLLSEFDIKFTTRKSVKGIAIAELLAENLVRGSKDVEFKFPNEELMQAKGGIWQLYFDGASNQIGYGIGILLVAPDESHVRSILN